MAMELFRELKLILLATSRLLPLIKVYYYDNTINDNDASVVDKYVKSTKMPNTS